MSTALWTGQIANCSAHVCEYVFARVRVVLDCWLSCVVEDIHTSKCQMCVPVSTLYTHLSVREQARIKCVRMCVYLEIVSNSYSGVQCLSF